MTLNRRLLLLEKQARRDCPEGLPSVADILSLKRWLHEKGVTPERALELGMKEPTGLHPYVTVKALVRARSESRKWRQERFGPRVLS